MYERPALFRREGFYELYVAADRSAALIQQLAIAGFDASRLDGEFGTEDPETGGQTELAVLRLPPDTDASALRKYLRQRSA